MTTYSIFNIVFTLDSGDYINFNTTYFVEKYNEEDDTEVVKEFTEDFSIKVDALNDIDNIELTDNEDLNEEIIKYVYFNFRNVDKLIDHVTKGNI